MRRILASAAIFFVISGTAVRAGQNVVLKHGKDAPTGIISGVVLGPDDKPAPHAAITYQSSAGSAPHAVHADSHGRFTITKLHTDTYDIRASAGGVFSEWQKYFQVQSGHTSEIELRLIYAREMPKSKGKAGKNN
jgi:hypothetical protein